MRLTGGVVNGGDHGDVGKMRATGGGIIRREHPASSWMRVIRQNALYGFAHGTEMHRDMWCVSDEASATVKDCA